MQSRPMYFVFNWKPTNHQQKKQKPYGKHKLINFYSKWVPSQLTLFSPRSISQLKIGNKFKEVLLGYQKLGIKSSLNIGNNVIYFSLL